MAEVNTLRSSICSAGSSIFADQSEAGARLSLSAEKQIVPRHLVPPAAPCPSLLVRGVDGDAVQPGTQRRIPSERVDLPGGCPERVLDDFLGVLLAARDPDRQPVQAVGISCDQDLGRFPLPVPQARHQILIPIDLCRLPASSWATIQ